MGLEATINAEDIHASLWRRKRREIIARTVAGGSSLALLLNMEAPVVHDIFHYNLPFSAAFDSLLLPYHTEALLSSLWLGLGLYGFTSMAQRLPLNPLRPSNWKGIGQAFRFTYHRFCNRFSSSQDIPLQESKEIAITALQSTKDPLKRREYEIGLDLIEKNYEQALQKALPLMQAHAQSRIPKNVIERFAFALIRYGTFYLSKPSQRDAYDMVASAISNLSGGYDSQAQKCFTKALQLAPNDIPLHCLYGYFLEMTHQEAHQQWQRTLERVLENPALTQQFRRLGKSKNEVLVIGGEGILQNSFVFKRSTEQEHLHKEYTLTSKLSEIFDGKDTVVQALAFLSHEGHHYCVLKRIAGDSVKEYLSTAGRQEVLARVLPFIAQFHQRLQERRNHLPAALTKTRDYGKYLTQTYAPRMHLPETAGVSKAIDYVAQQLASQRQQPIHGDLHPENILASKTGMTIIDPETMAFASPYLDVAAFLEHDILAVSAVEREQSLHLYHETLDSQTLSSEQTSLDYFHGALFRILQVCAAYEKQAYGLSMEELQQRKEYYAQRAFTLMQQIRAIDNKTAEYGLENLLLIH